MVAVTVLLAKFSILAEEEPKIEFSVEANQRAEKAFMELELENLGRSVSF